MIWLILGMTILNSVLIVTTIIYLRGQNQESEEPTTPPCNVAELHGPSGPSRFAIQDETYALIVERDELREWAWREQIKSEIKAISTEKLKQIIAADQRGAG